MHLILKNIYDYALKNAIAFKIGIVGSGEPLLQFDLIRQAVQFLNSLDTEQRISLYTISNGVHCTEEMLRFFFDNKKRIKLSFSLDGNEAVHDSCRKFASGKGSFSFVSKAIDAYIKIFGEKPSVNATVHKKTLENQSNVLAFFEKNFSQVCFSRLVDEESPALRITKAEFNDFLEAAKETSLSLRQCRRPQKYDCTMYGQLCGVGRTNIFYADGKIFPCGRFIGKEKAVIGLESDSLFKIEQDMKRFTPCQDGECYFDIHCKELDK